MDGDRKRVATMVLVVRVRGLRARGEVRMVGRWIGPTEGSGGYNT